MLLDWLPDVSALVDCWAWIGDWLQNDPSGPALAFFFPGCGCCGEPDPCDTCVILSDDFDRASLGANYTQSSPGAWSIVDDAAESTTTGARLSIATAALNGCAAKEIHFTVDVVGKARVVFGSDGGTPAELEFNEDDGYLSLFNWDGAFSQVELHRLSSISCPLDVRICTYANDSFKVYTRDAASSDAWQYRFGYPGTVSIPGNWRLTSGTSVTIDNLSISQNSSPCPECCKCWLFECPSQIEVIVSGSLNGSTGMGHCTQCESKRGTFILDRYAAGESDTTCLYAVEGDFGCGDTWMVCEIKIVDVISPQVRINYSGSQSGSPTTMDFRYPFTPLPNTWDGTLPSQAGGWGGVNGFCFNVDLTISPV